MKLATSSQDIATASIGNLTEGDFEAPVAAERSGAGASRSVIHEASIMAFQANGKEE